MTDLIEEKYVVVIEGSYNVKVLMLRPDDDLKGIYRKLLAADISYPQLDKDYVVITVERSLDKAKARAYDCITTLNAIRTITKRHKSTRRDFGYWTDLYGEAHTEIRDSEVRSSNTRASEPGNTNGT